MKNYDEQNWSGMIGAPCRSCFVSIPRRFENVLGVLLGIYWGYLPLSLIPEQGGYRSERGGYPNGLKGPPGHDGGRGPPAQRHRVHVVPRQKKDFV